MVFLLPFQSAHAATATVTLSTISPLSSTLGGPTELTGVTAGTVGSSLTLTGTGFATNAPIAVSTTVGTSTASWYPSASQNNCGGTFANAIGGVTGVDSLINTASPTGCVTTTAVGSFKSVFTVPALPGGPETIVVTDGTNTVSVPFTITPSVSFSKTSGTSNFGFPEQAIGGTISVTGFGSGESVTIATSMFVVTSFTCTTGTTLGGSATTGAGSCQAAVGTSIADVSGGSKTVTATGATSGLTATTTFTVNPWVTFYNSGADKTTYSFLGTAPTSVLVEGHGFAAGTISSNSITIGSVGTSHNAIVVSSTGTFYGVVLSPTANVPFGNQPVTIQGSTFSYANGNIALGSVTTGVAISTAGATKDFPWGGAFISSIAGTSTSTGIANIDSSSGNYKPGTGFSASSSNPKPVQNQIGFFGYGFVPATACGGAAGGAISIATPTGVTWSTSPVVFQGSSPTSGSPDCNGAFLAEAGLGDTAWSTSGAPTTAASYPPTVTQAGTAPANILSPSFGITPWVVNGASTVDYSTSTFTVSGHGFGATDSLTLTVGGASMVSGGTCATTNGFCATAAGQVPDLGAWPQNIVVTGSVTSAAVTNTAGTTFDPRINGGGTAATQALSSVAGTAGSTSILRTGTTFGVHGLYPNTAYDIIWNAGTTSPGVTGTVLGTFTSTATGGIPVPGVQFTIPADTSGTHIIDLQRTSAIGTSMMFSDNLQGDYLDTDPGLTSTTLQTNFGDMLFNEGTSLVAVPTVANVGGSVSVSGTGLAGSTVYDLGVVMAGGSPPSTCTIASAGQPSTVAGAFTSTSGGAVPSGTSVAINDMPTATGLEQGTLYCIFAQTGANFGSGPATGVAQFELQASANLNMSSAPIGHNVVLNAHGLNSNKGYNVLFAPYSCGVSGSTCGTVVGAILSNAQGAGSGTFTVPSTYQTNSGAQPVSSGAGYTVELQPVGSGNIGLASPPTLTVGSTTTGCQTTSCMTTSSGAISTGSVAGYKTVNSVWTNNSNAPQTVIVFAVVHNGAGQTVDVSTATITVSAGSSATATNVLFGLPSGTYSVTLFTTSTSGTAVSTTSTTTVTI